MADLSKKKAERVFVDRLEDGSIVKSEIRPAIAYQLAMQKSRKGTIRNMVAILIAEAIIAAVLVATISDNAFNTRFFREIEIRRTGEIGLSTGKYTGETDFGYFFGKGHFSFNTGASYEGNWSNNQLSGIGELKVE